MTLTEMKTEVASRLNLSSAEALARIAGYLNQRYRRLTSSLGLNTTRVVTASVNTVAGTDSISFTMEKIRLVYVTTAGQRRMLPEIQFEDYRILATEQQRSGKPKQYAIKSVTPTTVTIALYPNPDAIYSITADGLTNLSTLADGDTPAVPNDFQDALILGAMSDELFKMEKYSLAKDFQAQYEQRASDLRLFLAKSSYLSLPEVDTPGGLVTVVRKHWQA